MVLDEPGNNVRCEWGERGVDLLAPISNVIVIVDVLSFSTSVEIAANQGALVYPYRWRDETAHDYARSAGAEVADRGNKKGYSLSPASLLSLPSNTRLVMPSPNGSELSLSTGSTPTLAGCLRNCEAVAGFAMRSGKNIAVVPAGERWEDGTLRPCVEDLIGAGAIIRYLNGRLSPEAKAALAVFEDAASSLFERIKGSGSGVEKVEKGEEGDIVLAAALNVSGCVPLLTDGAYRKA